MAQAAMRKASDDAHKAQLAFATGNHRPYMEAVFARAKAALDAAYDEMNGERELPVSE